MMDEGSVEVGEQSEVKLPASEVVWLEVPESATQSVTTGGVKAMALKEFINECWSHTPIHGDQVGATTYYWCGGCTDKGMR
jgi:hypothetical protein